MLSCYVGGAPNFTLASHWRRFSGGAKVTKVTGRQNAASCNSWEEAEAASRCDMQRTLTREILHWKVFN